MQYCNVSFTTQPIDTWQKHYVNCTAHLSTGFKILVAGGFIGGMDFVTSNTVELIDTSGKLCMLPDLPYRTGRAAGGVLEGQPIICGGFMGTGWVRHSKCYKLAQDGSQWIHFATMDHGRSRMSGIVIGNKIWLSGGWGQNANTSSLLIAIDGNVFKGPNLPEPLDGHSAIQINNNQFMILGGSNSKNTTLFDTNLSFIKQGPSMNLERDPTFSCSIQSSNHGGRNVIIVAGSNFVELLDFTVPGSSWQFSELE